jgi:hypothetical protein
VSTQLQTLLSQLIWDVELGIGPIKNVLPAQTTGSSTVTACVFQFLITVNLMMLQVPVLHALLVMT